MDKQLQEAVFNEVMNRYGKFIYMLIREKFEGEICEQVELSKLILDHPIELAYSLSLISSFIENKKTHSITRHGCLRTTQRLNVSYFVCETNPVLVGAFTAIRH